MVRSGKKMPVEELAHDSRVSELVGEAYQIATEISGDRDVWRHGPAVRVEAMKAFAMLKAVEREMLPP